MKQNLTVFVVLAAMTTASGRHQTGWQSPAAFLKFPEFDLAPI